MGSTGTSSVQTFVESEIEKLEELITQLRDETNGDADIYKMIEIVDQVGERSDRFASKLTKVTAVFNGEDEEGDEEQQGEEGEQQQSQSKKKSSSRS